MKGVKELTKKEMMQTVGGFCPYTKEYIREHANSLMAAGKKEAAYEFLRQCYELGC